MELSSLLHQTFGFPAFRANQEAVCRAATDGRDVLLVMPTGAGKSLCYQLPAIARGGTGLVVSPLIALMDDQANKLTAAGLKVARIHSGLSREDARQACRDYLDGTLQFLFIAPERMRVPGFPAMLAKRKPSLIAIDEAHCISAWGHDFRPDYRTLGEHLPALRPSPIIALTATATPTVQKDIVAQLNLDRPALFIHGFRRDNLAIEVVEMSRPRRNQFTVDYLADKSRRPAIVYAPSRKAAEELAGELGRRYKAAAYHAGLEAGVRERVQAKFQSGELEVVVATIAFGMGIDKADVRTVVHVALPASVEAFYQEIGRAGRDGQPSRTILLYSFVDRRIHDGFLERDYPALTELQRVAGVLTDDYREPEYLAQKLRMPLAVAGKSLEKLAAQGAAVFDFQGMVRRGANARATDWQAGYTQQVEFRRNQIERMMQFAEGQQCRMTALIRHFGDTADATRPCGHCDFCAPQGASATVSVEPDAEQERQLRTILSALSGGMGKATGKLFTDLALTKDRKQFDALLDGLARAGLVTLTAESFIGKEGKAIAYKKASLTFEGQTLAPGEALGVTLRADETAAARSRGGSDAGSGQAARQPRAAARSSREKPAEPAFSPGQRTLAERLRAFRTAEATRLGMPPYIVFNDASLNAIALACPQTLGQLAPVYGFSMDKAEKYGAEIVRLCREAASGDLPDAPQTATAAEDTSAQKREPRREREQARTDLAAGFNAKQNALAAELKAWRLETAKQNGWPAFRVLTDAQLYAIVAASPRTPAGLREVPGLNAAKADLYEEDLLRLCSAQTALPAKAALVSPSVQALTATPPPAAALSGSLEDRLRAWRQSEADRLGQPQFFILGTSALRSIVETHPRTMAQLRSIDSLGPEKLDRFGASILAVCNAAEAGL